MWTILGSFSSFVTKLFGRKAEATRLLEALGGGGVLKAHRDLDGGKVHRLHLLHGDVHTVEESVVRRLCQAGLIASNKKFPAATYLLTDRGKRALGSAVGAGVKPVSVEGFGDG